MKDPRADPDDDERSPRVDVVAIDRSERVSTATDALSNAAVLLRRELAKLHQQAAAVERTIEDQKRERAESIERIDATNARAEELAQKLSRAEADLNEWRRQREKTLEELETTRTELENTTRALEAATATAEDLARARAEIETLRSENGEALRTTARLEAELEGIRARERAETDKGESELQSLRERLERSNAELSSLREENSQSKSEIVHLRQQTTDASGRQADLERERDNIREQSERLERALADARAEARTTEGHLAAVGNELAATRIERTEAKSEIDRLERDLAEARRVRDVNLDRALMAERDSEVARADVTRLQRDLEAAATTLANTTTRALAAERARDAIEESVKQLRDEVTSAFARWRSATPSVIPAAQSAPPPTRAIPVSRDPARPNDGLTLDDDWPAPAPSNVPNDVSPGALAPLAALAAASLAPQQTGEVAINAQEKAVPVASSPVTARPGIARPSPLPKPAPPSVPPPLPPIRSSAPPRSERSLSDSHEPAVVYPSVPPVVAPSAAPAPRHDSSAVEILSSDRERDDLFELLVDPATAKEAADGLRDHPEWLSGRPPVELLMALSHLDYDIDHPVFELARTWERGPIARALVAALRDEPDPKLREHAAWLLKHFGAPATWPTLAEVLLNEEETVAVRRWLLEGVERLVASRGIGWSEVGDLMKRLVHHGDPSLRDGVVGVVAALETRDEKRRLLLDLLRTEADEGVLARAVQALESALPIQLDPSVAERLLGHPSARVQRSVVEFIERTKRAHHA